MKSKKANEFFADERVAFRTGGTYYVVEVDARKAIELAEEDARERAVKAFCKHCKTTRNPARCDGVMYCPIADNYIKKYDNGE